MAMVQSLSIEGYKSIRQLQLPCGQRNLILGPNGAGKSSLLEALDLVRQVLQAPCQPFALRGSDYRFHHHGPKRTPQFWVRLQTDSVDYSFRFVSEFGRSSLDSQRFGLSKGQLHIAVSQGGLPNWSDWPEEVEATLQPGLSQLRDLIASYHFHDTSATSLMRRECSVDDNRQLRADGTNLAAFLYWLSRNQVAAYLKIVDTFRRVAPWFASFSLQPKREEQGQIKLEWRHRDSDNYFDGFSLSDGSLRFLCLCTLLLQPSPPAILLLDEPELGLHPLALTLLAEMLQAVDSQVFVATQSTSLVDQFEPEDIVVSDFGTQSASFQRLDRQHLESWLERYSLGELWEKNILGGRP